MDALASECESGWTLYLEQSLTNKRLTEEEEEGSSTVSDATSGPPLPHFLDDTATSSPAFNFSKNNLGMTSHAGSMESVLYHSQGFSATHFQLPFYQDHHHYHFCYIQPSLPGNQLQRLKSEEVKKLVERLTADKIKNKKEKKKYF